MPDRIAMVSNTYYQADPRLRRQAEALVARGYAVDVICPSQADNPALENVCGVHVWHVATRKYRGRRLSHYMLSNAAFFVRAFVKLTRLQVHHGYAAVQVYSMPEALALTALWPRLVGVPLIYDAGDLTTEVYASRFRQRTNPFVAAALRGQEWLGLRFSDVIITVHEEYWRRLLQRGVARERLHVVMNLPDHHAIRRALAATTIDSPSPGQDEFLFVHHGSLVERYGVDLAVRAVAALRARIPGLRLWIYGDGDLRPRLLELIDELGVGDCVKLHPGYVPFEQLLPQLAAAFAAIVPTRRDPFTDTILPNKLLEYLALGLPTVVSRTRTVLDHVPSSAVEYCDPDDVTALASAMQRLCSDPAHRRRLAANARGFASKHSWENESEKYAALVADIVRAGRVSSAHSAACGVAGLPARTRTPA